MAREYFSYTLAAPARALYANAAEASKPRNVPEAKSKYSVTLGLEDADARALFDLQTTALKKAFGSFTGPDDYVLCCISGEKAAARALASAEINARGKPSEEREKIMEAAEARAAMFRPYAGILNASSHTALHDRFTDRYMNELTPQQRENADRMGFRLAVISGGQFITLDTPATFGEYKDKFYRGAYLGGSFNLNAWPRKRAEDKDGVTAYLKTLIFVKDGERLASARPLADEFAHYRGVATDYSPAAAASGEPPVDPHAF